MRSGRRQFASMCKDTGNFKCQLKLSRFLVVDEPERVFSLFGLLAAPGRAQAGSDLIGVSSGLG